MTQPVLSQIEDGVAIVTLNRPGTANAMSPELCDALLSAVAPLAEDRTVRAWLIGANGKNFCGGGDLSTFRDAADPSAAIAHAATELHKAMRILAEHRAPVLVAVQGAAAGAGLSLVTGADIALAATSASFLWAYTAVGLTVDGGASWTLPRLVGLRRAQELAYTGRRLSAEEAQQWGIVTRVVADEALQDEALTLAKAIARGPTESFGIIKGLFARTFAEDFTAQLDAERDAIAAALGRPDGINAVAAFLEKRKPTFTGD